VDFLPECGGYGLFNHAEYFSEVDKYRDKGCRFYAGAEIDYAMSVGDEIAETLANWSFDFTICSVHMIDGISVSDGENLERFTDEEYLLNMLVTYYKEAKASLESDMFDVIGHLGIYKRYLSGIIENSVSAVKYIREMDDALAKKCSASDILLEVNTSGLFSPYKSTLPDPDFLKRFLSIFVPRLQI
jgi:histidinol-phosphatase (PHP family)